MTSSPTDRFGPAYIKPKKLPPRKTVEFSYSLGTPLPMVCEGFSQEVALTFRGDKLDFCEACFRHLDKHYHLMIGLDEDESLYLKIAEAFSNPMAALMTVRKVWSELSDIERSLYAIKE